MTRSEAKKLAETVTVNDLKYMFVTAYGRVKNWEAPSRGNKGLSVGTVFNLFTKGGISEDTHKLAKINMIREFGEYLPNYEKKKRLVLPTPNVYHQKPSLLDESFYDYDISSVLK